MIKIKNYDQDQDYEPQLREGDGARRIAPQYEEFKLAVGPAAGVTLLTAFLFDSGAAAVNTEIPGSQTFQSWQLRVLHFSAFRHVLSGIEILVKRA